MHSGWQLRCYKYNFHKRIRFTKLLDKNAFSLLKNILNWSEIFMHFLASTYTYLEKNPTLNVCTYYVYYTWLTFASIKMKTIEQAVLENFRALLEHRQSIRMFGFQFAGHSLFMLLGSFTLLFPSFLKRIKDKRSLIWSKRGTRYWVGN